MLAVMMLIAHSIPAEGRIAAQCGVSFIGQAIIRLVVAVIGGVITSSLLTLVVVPVAYCYLDDLAGWLKRRWGQKPAPADR